MNNDDRIALAFIVLAAFFIIVYLCAGCKRPASPDNPPVTVVRLGTNAHGHVYILEPFDWEYNSNKDSDDWR